MSTKIYNGYRIDPAPTLRELSLRMQSFGESVRAVTDKMMAKLIASLAVKAFDAFTLKLPIPWLDAKDAKQEITPAYDAWTHIIDRQKKIKATRSRDPEVDFDCNVCVVPSGRKIFALLYTEQDVFHRMWQRVEGVRAYPYWNNTDPPRGVTSKQWRRREREWMQALGKECVPARVGFTYETQEEYPTPPFRRRIARLLPNDSKERARHWAKAILRDQFCRARIGKDKSWQNWMKLLREFAEWSKTDDGEKKIAPKAEALAQILKPKILPDDLYERLGSK